jgi:hypothetical protein
MTATQVANCAAGAIYRAFIVFAARRRRAQVAQLVEQRIENPRVGGSIPSLGTGFPGDFGRL